MHRYQYISLDFTEETSSLATIHGDLKNFLRVAWFSFAVDTRERRLAKIHESDGDVILFRYFAQLLNVHSVACEVDGVWATVRSNTEIFSMDDEPNTFLSWPVLARCGGYVEKLS